MEANLEADYSLPWTPMGSQQIRDSRRCPSCSNPLELHERGSWCDKCLKAET